METQPVIVQSQRWYESQVSKIPKRPNLDQKDNLSNPQTTLLTRSLSNAIKERPIVIFVTLQIVLRIYSDQILEDKIAL